MSFSSTRAKIIAIRRGALIQQATSSSSNQKLITPPRGAARLQAFSTSQSSQNQQQKKKEKEKSTSQDDSLPAGVSPWARFMDVLKSEYAKSQEIQENVRELTGTAQGIKDSEAAQKMRKAYTAMRLETLIKENPKLASMAQSLSSTGKSVSEAVNKAAHEIEESRLMQAAKRMSKEIDRRIAEPIRKTQVYKVVEDTVDFSQGALRYGGYIEKEERNRRRMKRLERLAKANPASTIISGSDLSAAAPLSSSSSSSSTSTSSSSSSPPPPTTTTTTATTTTEESAPLNPSEHEPQIAENPDAPPALVLHATANQETSEEGRTMGSRMKGTLTGSGFSEMWKAMQEGYAESENPVVSSLRSVSGFFRRTFLDETETAKVIRLVKEVDPCFNYDAFLADLREFIIPDFLDSFVDNDLTALKAWTSEAAFNVTTAPMKMYLQRGLRPANQIIDLKGIDIISAKVLEERDLPVFVVAFKTHEINCYINPAKRPAGLTPSTGGAEGARNNNNNDNDEDACAVEVGSREDIQAVQYVLVLAKDAHLNAATAQEQDEHEEHEDHEEAGGAPHKAKAPDGTPGKQTATDDKQSASNTDHAAVTGGWKIIDLARRGSLAFL
ncbi:hypothetical protein PCASD_13549 [Puccinia coronata f. sp. avenae]|uniref:Tim44-like domain-containing protein n=1 Tax=Puccinia coronata f. sp. avenae TaxID=200324 RepID=A0A2N5TDW3_9BASI|nr:hypothetical protein PCASD_13549 [Puccinia coronata f. sp. avenae]